MYKAHDYKGKWCKGNEVKADGEIGRFVADGNTLSFNLKHDYVFPSTFVGNVDYHYIKVYTHGKDIGYDSEFGYSYRISKALLYNDVNYNTLIGDIVEGIESVSFEVPELADWLEHNSVRINVDQEGALIIQQVKIETIILKKDSPEISIDYELEHPLGVYSDRNEMTLRCAPRVFIKYDTLVNDILVINDIQKIMRFFALLIGRISYAHDIRVSLSGHKSNLWMFLNYDFSHNNLSNSYWLRTRTMYKDMADSLNKWFEAWHNFSNDENFQFIQNVFFRYTGKYVTRAEELFLTYCKFLEGYDLRVTNDEEVSQALRDKLVEVLKGEKARELFEQPFSEVKSKFKGKEESIADSIAQSFLERKSLSSRLQRLDKLHLGCIAENSNNIIGTEDKNKFFSKISQTRNYYSHFKADSSNILTINEMYRTIEVLEVLIVSILLSEMGIDIDKVKKIMAQDDRYWYLLPHIGRLSQHK